MSLTHEGRYHSCSETVSRALKQDIIVSCKKGGQPSMLGPVNLRSTPAGMIFTNILTRSPKCKAFLSVFWLIREKCQGY